MKPSSIVMVAYRKVAVPGTYDNCLKRRMFLISVRLAQFLRMCPARRGANLVVERRAIDDEPE